MTGSERRTYEGGRRELPGSNESNIHRLARYITEKQNSEKILKAYVSLIEVCVDHID